MSGKNGCARSRDATGSTPSTPALHALQHLPCCRHRRGGCKLSSTLAAVRHIPAHAVDVRRHWDAWQNCKVALQDGSRCCPEGLDEAHLWQSGLSPVPPSELEISKQTQLTLIAHALESTPHSARGSPCWREGGAKDLLKEEPERRRPSLAEHLSSWTRSGAHQPRA